MKLKHQCAIALCMLIVLACGSRERRSALGDLKELGFHVVISGKVRHVSFREYGAGSTHRELPVADFPNVPVLGTGDYFLLYGDMPEGPLDTGVSAFLYERIDGTYIHRSSASIESFFSLEPLDPMRGQKVTKLTPKTAAPPGVYFLHKYPGMEGDAYLAFRLSR